MSISCLIVAILGVFLLSEAAEYRLSVKRLNNLEPIISGQYKTPYGSSIYSYNYNAAFVPPNGKEEKGYGLLVRSQNTTSDSNPFQVGPSVITYVRMKTALEEEDNVLFEKITSKSEVIFPDGPSNSFGTEDPRVTLDESTGIYYIFYSAVENTTEGVPVSKLALATTKNPSDRSTYTFHGPILPDIKWSKSGALLIRQKKPSFLIWGDASIVPGIQLATTNDLIHYENKPGIYLNTRNDSFDSLLVEAGPSPLELSDGRFLFLYNSARRGYPSNKPNWDIQYNVGWIVFDGDDPTRIFHRSDKPLMSPELDWEKGTGSALNLTPNVIFVEGWVRHPTKKDHFLLYYGGADAVMGLAELAVEIV